MEHEFHSAAWAKTTKFVGEETLGGTVSDGERTSLSNLSLFIFYFQVLVKLLSGQVQRGQVAMKLHIILGKTFFIKILPSSSVFLSLCSF